MPALISRPAGLVVRVHNSPTDIPRVVWDAFRAHEKEANIIYPHALRATSGDQLWISAMTHGADGSVNVDFVLSCTEYYMGNYPVFIFSTRRTASMDEHFLLTRVDALAKKLHELVPTRRVYSIFAENAVSISFASTWQNLTGIPLEPTPYYAATFTFCTTATLTKRRVTFYEGSIFNLRHATEADLAAVTRLCHGFAAVSEPFVLTHAGAEHEAREMISKRCVWVHEIQLPGQPVDVASIVCITRQSENIAGITKVYTNPNWRQRGCAERLVRRVCQFLLFEEGKQSVVLYVAHNNLAAEKVYRRVGFVGLLRKKIRVDGVEPWLELGFAQNRVELGHW